MRAVILDRKCKGAWLPGVLFAAVISLSTLHFISVNTFYMTESQPQHVDNRYDYRHRTDSLIIHEEYHQALSCTWLTETILSRNFSPYRRFYNVIRDYIDANGSFPFHLVNNQSLFRHVLGIEEIVQTSVEGDPFHHLGNITTPCWTSRSGIKCLPAFLLIGSPKCGSTSLFARLSAHPQITPSSRKEPYFWSIDKGQRLSRYLALFNSFNKRVSTALQHHDTHFLTHHLTGEGDPGTLWRSDVWHDVTSKSKLGEPEYITPLTVSAFVPRAKFLLIIRNPTDRTFSHYQHFSPMGEQSANHFHQLVVSLVKHAQSLIKAIGLRGFAYRYSKRTKFGCLSGSLYYVFLRDWLDVVSRDRIHIIMSDYYFKDTVPVIQDMAAFLNLDPYPQSYVDQVYEQPTQPIREQNKVFTSMLNETREILDIFYKPFNILLADLLDDHKYLIWNKPR